MATKVQRACVRARERREERNRPCESRGAAAAAVSGLVSECQARYQACPATPNPLGPGLLSPQPSLSLLLLPFETPSHPNHDHPTGAEPRSAIRTEPNAPPSPLLPFAHTRRQGRPSSLPSHALLPSPHLALATANVVRPTDPSIWPKPSRSRAGTHLSSPSPCSASRRQGAPPRPRPSIPLPRPTTALASTCSNPPRVAAAADL